MRINFSAWAIRNPVPPILLFVVLCLLGFMSFKSLPVTKFPNIDIPVVSVTVTQGGATPAELETQVTREVEDAVANVTGVKHIISTVTDGSSVTAIEFHLDVNTDRAVVDVKDAIDKIRANLPRTVDEPIVSRIDVEGQSILSFAATSPGMTLEQLSWHVDDVIKRRLMGLKGIGKVERYGGVKREIRVELDPDRLLAFGVTAAEVNRQVRATNADLGSGRGEVGAQEQAIRVLAGARTVEDLADAKINLANGRQVRLSDLGRVYDGASEQRSFGRLNGQPVVAFAIFRAKGSSEMTVRDNVERELARLRADYPEIEMTKIDDAVAYTQGNYEAAIETLIEGSVLAVVVVLLFLRNLRATMIAAIALPLSAIPAFWFMSLFGFSLNLVSLLAITLVTGILVDDAIVEIENIVRHQNMGKSPYRAALEAADEIGLAVIAISLTIVAIFAPVSFMSGIAGQYFRQFGLTVAAAVLVSLLVARLITPMMAAYLMRPIKEKHTADGLLMRAYTRFLSATLRWRYITLLAGLGLFAGSIYATYLLPSGFIPDGDESRLVISAELPPGSQLEETSRMTDTIYHALKDIPEVSTVYALGGTSPTGSLDVRRAAIVVRLVPKAQRTRSQKSVEGVVMERLKNIPDLRSWAINGRNERQLAYNLVSTDGDALRKAATDVEAKLRTIPIFRGPASEAALERPEIRIVPRSDTAARLGVSTDQISETVRVATIGDVEFNLAKFNAGDRQVPIRVQLKEDTRENMQRLKELRVTNNAGQQIPLTAVADVRFGQGPSLISRYDRLRNAKIGTDLAPGVALSQGQEQFLKAVKDLGLPKSVALRVVGEAEMQGEVVQGFITAILTGLVLVFGVLILLFSSVTQPITILLSLPLSFGGVVIGLLATNNAVTMPVYIGLIMLVGIVTKNAIMLVDFAVERMAAGMSRTEAIIDAGRKRARPIIMTTLAMVAGMVPSAYALGDGGEFRSPMAIAVIGGLLVSTVLSLIFVPSFFTVMDDVGHFLSWVFGRFIGPRDDPEDDAARAAERAAKAARSGDRHGLAQVPAQRELPLAAE
ncbi:MAG TPA: efflux RND transporter permease subunit [Hyphomicrobium sp.]|nr:efflux RND transporter permease subunit [Hyphomicrobium sp.]